MWPLGVLKAPSTGARNLIVKQTTVGIFPIRMYLDSSHRITANINDEGSAFMTLVGTTAPLTDTTNYHHLAFTKQGSVGRLFLDGTLLHSVTEPSFGSIRNNISDWLIGAANNTGAGNFGGLIDWIKLSKTALYTSNFTPPTTLTV